MTNTRFRHPTLSTSMTVTDIVTDKTQDPQIRYCGDINDKHKFQTPDNVVTSLAKQTFDTVHHWQTQYSNIRNCTSLTKTRSRHLTLVVQLSNKQSTNEHKNWPNNWQKQKKKPASVRGSLLVSSLRIKFLSATQTSMFPQLSTPTPRPRSYERITQSLLETEVVYTDTVQRLFVAGIYVYTEHSFQQKQKMKNEREFYPFQMGSWMSN